MGSRSAHRVFGSASTFQCPVLAEKTAAKPVGEIVCWKAGSGRSKAKVRSQPQREDVESSRMQGKGLGDWGKDAEGSPGRRLIKFSGHHQPCPPCAHQSASRTSAACSPILLDGLDKPAKSVFGELCLRSQSQVLGKWLLYFKRVVEKKEQPQNKPLRNILQ